MIRSRWTMWGAVMVLAVSACTNGDDAEDTIAVEVGLDGAGEILSRPAGIACQAGRCRGDFYVGDLIQLAAVPVDGWVFEEWVGDCVADEEMPTQARYEVEGGSESCTAQFRRWMVGDPITEPATFRLEVEGPGSVHITPGDEVCRTDEVCTLEVQAGSQVFLAVDSRAPAFLEWSGDCAGQAPDTVATAYEDTSCRARFDDATYFPFRFDVRGEGTVMSTPSGIECGNGKADCEWEFKQTTFVLLNAYAAPGWSFQEWGHQCIDEFGNGYTVTSLEVVAEFGLACSATFVEGGGGGGGNQPPAGWTCLASFYDAGDGCDCGCGVVDPDCTGTTATWCDYCTSCADGDCANVDPFDNSQCDDGGGGGGVPAAWTCSANYYGAGDGCDCGCGAVDSDCPSSSSADCVFCLECGDCSDVNPIDNSQCL